MSYIHQNPASSTRRETIVQFLYAVSGTYGDAYRRNYAPMMNAGTYQNIMDHILGSKNPNLSVTSAQLSQLAPGMLTMGSPTDQDRVSVAHGWGTQRLIFVLTLDVTDSFEKTTRYVINGYSDHADLSTSGLPDPRCVMAINSVQATDITPGVNRLVVPGV